MPFVVMTVPSTLSPLQIGVAVGGLGAAFAVVLVVGAFSWSGAGAVSASLR